MQCDDLVHLRRYVSMGRFVAYAIMLVGMAWAARKFPSHIWAKYRTGQLVAALLPRSSWSGGIEAGDRPALLLLRRRLYAVVLIFLAMVVLELVARSVVVWCYTRHFET
jgi:hypothetical protein